MKISEHIKEMKENGMLPASFCGMEMEECFHNYEKCLEFIKFISTFTNHSKPTDYNHRFLINNAINAKELLKELGELE